MEATAPDPGSSTKDPLFACDNIKAKIEQSSVVKFAAGDIRKLEQMTTCHHKTTRHKKYCQKSLPKIWWETALLLTAETCSADMWENNYPETAL
jgi:hypothetical protein